MSTRAVPVTVPTPASDPAALRAAEERLQRYQQEIVRTTREIAAHQPKPQSLPVSAVLVSLMLVPVTLWVFTSGGSPWQWLNLGLLVGLTYLAVLSDHERHLRRLDQIVLALIAQPLILVAMAIPLALEVPLSAAAIPAIGTLLAICGVLQRWLGPAASRIAMTARHAELIGLVAICLSWSPIASYLTQWMLP